MIQLTCVEALSDGGGINKESTAKGAVDVWVELVKGEFGLNKGLTHEIISISGVEKRQNSNLITAISIFCIIAWCGTDRYACVLNSIVTSLRINKIFLIKY